MLVKDIKNSEYYQENLKYWDFPDFEKLPDEKQFSLYEYTKRICRSCGTESKACVINIISGKLRVCSMCIRMSVINALTGPNIKIIKMKDVEYLKKCSSDEFYSSDVEFECTKCGRKFSCNLASIRSYVERDRNGDGSLCSCQWLKYDQTYYKDQFEKVIPPSEYKFLEFIPQNGKIAPQVKLIHIKCGNECTYSYYDFLRHYTDDRYLTRKDVCYKCAQTRPYTKEELAEEVRKERGDEFEFVDWSDYQYDFYHYHRYFKVRCLKCKQVIDVTISNFFTNHSRCPHCTTKARSVSEKEVEKFIAEKYDKEIKSNHRKIHDVGEIDIYLPDINVGIEYNGNFWHNFNNVGSKATLNKVNSSESHNIHMVQIMEDEWENLDKAIILKDRLEHIVGTSNDTKISSRKCIIDKASTSDVNIFYIENDLNGAISSNVKYNYVLKYNNEIVFAMSFIDKRDGKFQIIRTTTKVGFTVYGAFSRLIKYFLLTHKNCNKLYYDADRRYIYRNDNFLLKNGFIEEKLIKPMYWYCDSSYNRQHRLAFTKAQIKRKIPEVYDEKLSEKEMMEKTKIFRVYDAGYIRYVLNL